MEGESVYKKNKTREVNAPYELLQVLSYKIDIIYTRKFNRLIEIS